MAPSPMFLQRTAGQTGRPAAPSHQTHAPGITTPLIATAALVALVATLGWARRWTFSGAAIETLVLLYGYGQGHHIFPDVPLWTVVATLNLIYAVSSTSWLLWWTFAAACYPFIAITCLFQFAQASDMARRGLRKVLGELHFTRDRIALFNLPALEIDVDVNGLMVIRGVTIHLSTLSLIVHGVEVGLKMTDDIELALYTDEVKISLFRRVEVGAIYGNVKGLPEEMTFADVNPETDLDDAASVDEVLLDNTPLLRAATVGSEKLKERPKLRESLTGVSYMKDTSAQSGFESIKTMSPDDKLAEKRYQEILTDIRTSSTIYQCRQQVRKKAMGENAFQLDTDNDMRAAICAEMQNMPSIAHPPVQSVRVSTLKQLSPPNVRDFMHRLPFLYRALLAVVSYFHAISFASISVAGSGRWLSAMLQSKVFKAYTESSTDLRKLERRVSAWLANANFCLQLADIEGLGVVPLSTDFDIVAYLKFSDIMAYRTVPDEGTIAQVVRLGGADATVTVPSYMLPHHEHLVPAKASDEEKVEQEFVIEQADGKPKTKQAKADLESMEKDETHVSVSVHASLPAAFDQSLLNFIAALVKATKMIEMERDVDEVVEQTANGVENPQSPTFSDADNASVAEGDEEEDPANAGLQRSATTPASTTSGHARKDSGFKTLATKIHHNLKQSTAHSNAQVRNLFVDLGQKTKDGIKRTVVGGMVNDRWIAKLVGRVAANLQNMQGDLGYSGKIPVPLATYRGEPGLASKLLP